MSADLVILYSGGADSRLMLELAFMAERLPYCVLIDYGQKHVKELKIARRQLEDKNISYQIIKIDNWNVNSGLTGELVEGKYEGVHPMNVPARNIIFLGFAMSIAESKGIDEVWYGPDYSDRINLFPDCYQEFVVQMNKVSEISGVKPIKIVAPLMGMPKELILRILEKYLGITEDELFSGYGDNR